MICKLTIEYGISLLTLFNQLTIFRNNLDPYVVLPNTFYLVTILVGLLSQSVFHSLGELAIIIYSICHCLACPFCRIFGPLSIIIISIWISIDSFSVFSTLRPHSHIFISIYVLHSPFSVENSSLKLPSINIASFILIFSCSL